MTSGCEERREWPPGVLCQLGRIEAKLQAAVSGREQQEPSSARQAGIQDGPTQPISAPAHAVAM